MREALAAYSSTNLVVLLDERKITANTDARVHAAVAAASNKVEVKSWADMADQYHQIVMLFNNIFGFVTALVAIIIFAGILITMTMAVMERVSELSTIRAMGASRSNLLVMVLSEGVVVGLLSVVFSVICGILIAEAINQVKIQMPAPPGSTFSFPLRMLLNVRVVLLPVFLSLFATVVGGFIPAYRAAKMPISEAMQR